MRLFLTILLILGLYGCGVAGKDITNESKPNTAITLYALTDKGISISETNGTTWGRLIQKTRINNLASSVMNAICLFQNKHIIATDYGLSVATGNSYETYFENTAIKAMVNNGTSLFVATTTGIFTTTANFQWQEVSPTPASVLALNGETLYVGEKNRIDTVKTTATKNITSKLVSDNIIALALQGNDLLTLTTKALYINNQHNETLGATNCTALFVDAKKNIWVATDLGLAKSNDGKSWMIFDTTSGLPKTNINEIYVDNINIYLATDSGLIQSINGGETWKTSQRQQGLVSSKVLRVLVQK